MKKKKFKIALAQIKIEQKNIEKNYKKIFKKIEEAAKENVDIICFPELATIGYTITADELQNLPKDFENTFIEYKEHKILIYNEDENLVNILPKFVNLDKFLLLSGYDKNFSLNSNIYDCKAIILNITKSFPTIKGGGGKNKGNIKLDRAYNRNELIEIIKKGIDEQ